MLAYTVYFVDGTSVDVVADSLEDAEQAAHEETATDTPIDCVVPHEIEPSDRY